MAGALGLVRGAWVKGISLAAFGSVLLHPMAVWAEPMSVPGKFAVSASGAATYSIPISLPPGSAGMEPSLKLEYNNQSGNGLLGVGWSLAGLPSILRCSRTVAQDGVVGGVKFDANDRFCLEGQRLIVVSGTYGADGAEYRTEIDTYSRIVSHGSAGAGPAWFEVRTKSGQVMEFGHTADSQILAQGKTSARAWAASKVADSKGNYFAVRYTNDATNGQYYPVEIDYTGNAAASVAPYNKVQFVYAARPDVIPQYQAGSLVQTTVRMTDVRTFVGAALVADYKFVYEQSGPANRSRLVSVTVCEGGGSCLPATTVNWTSATAGLTAPQQWIAQYVINAGWTDTNTYPRMLVDVNGDGLPDVVGFGGDGVDVSLNTGTSFGPLQNWIAYFVPAAGYQGNDVYPRMLADVNGDGLPDVVGFAATGVYVSLNTGTSFGTPQLWVAYFVKNAGFSDSNTYPRMLADLNGDGLPDVVGFAATGVYASLNAGANFGPPPDIVSSLSTGLGTKTAISYLPATNKSVATKGTGTAFPLLDLSAPVFLVSQVDASNGIGGTYSSRYTYSGGRVDTRGRGFLGFAQTTIKDLQTGVVEATNYRQDFPFIGVASSSTRTLGTQILSQSASSYQFSNASGGTTISPASAPYRMWLSQNVSSSQDLDGTTLPTVTTGYQYDSYGNPTQVSASTSDGFSKTTVNTYANDTTNWYLGRLIGAAVTSSTP